MEYKEVESAIEAILFAVGDPVPLERLAVLVGIESETVEGILTHLADLYSYERRGMRIIQLEDKYQMVSSPEHAECVRHALETRKAPPLSPAALEVLSIIAYRQPVTRTFVEQIRGVDSTYTVSSLVEKGLIAECGRLDVPGRPMLFKTTDVFLRAFGLTTLDELPDLPEFAEDVTQLSFGQEVV